MDGSETGLSQFLPFFLQDHLEIGADPDAFIRLTSRHCENHSDLKVLDPGCGKGAVSVNMPKSLGYRIIKVIS